MHYIIYFEFSSLLFILPFLAVVLFKKKVPNRQNFFYFIMVMITALNILLSITSSYSLQFYKNYAVWLQFILNSLYLLGQAANVLMLFLYILAVTETLKSLKLWHHIALFLPFLITVLTILTNFITKSVFDIKDGSYSYGNLHFILYVNSFFYICFCLATLLVRRRQTEKTSWYLTLIIISLLIAAVIVQCLEPRLMITNTAAVLGIVLVYIFLQAPGHYIDKTTGLFNHNTLPAIVNNYFDKKKDFFLIILTIDDYKNIDKLVGTKSKHFLVIKIGEYLSQVFGKDCALRLSSDEFAFFYPDTLEDLQAAKNLIAKIPRIWQVGLADIQISFSSICLNSKDYILAETFLSNIDYASTYCKQFVDNVCFLDKKATEQIQFRFKVETLLKKAVADGRIEVYFQPIYNIKQQKFTSLEALARLYDSELGFIPPSVFIPIAEQNGIINKLGEIVLEKVCMLLKMNDLKSCGITKVDVNLSVAQCMQVKLYEQINNILNKYGTDRSMLCFEITESAATISFSTLKNNMDELSKTGIKFALDDYGMGYSSLNYLMKLPFSCLKTDKDLLWSAVENKRSEILFECIMYMADKLDLQIISEGAQTAKHLNFLQRKGVQLIQGFYYATPMKPDEMLQFIKLNNLKD